MSPQRRGKRPPNIIFFGIDSLRADHMSLYGYPRLTTPHMDRFAQGGTVFDRTYSAYIPTTPAYTSMFTGMDLFSHQVVALRHKGGLRPEVKTLAEVLRRTATPPPASASAATRPRVGSTATSTFRAGAVGTRAAARRRRTSTRSPFRSWIG